MKLSRHTLLNLCLILAAFAVAASMYNSLPDLVPIHWNARGIVNGYTPKPWGAFMLPLMMVGLYLLFLVLPAVSPGGFRISRFMRVYWILCSVTLAFLLVTTVFALLMAQGISLPLNRIINAGIGLLLMIIGNFLGKVTKNFFVGIRTPWTLASDEVWFRTHRFAGKLFVLVGFVVVIAGVLGYAGTWQVWVIIAAAIVSVIYSAVIYKRIEGFKDDSAELSNNTFGSNHSGK
jgi:immunity protein, SdpI family